MRAGFLFYIKGDFVQAEGLFAEAADKGVSDATLWRGLALLAEDRIDEAERALRGALRSGSDSASAVAASVGLAACDLAAGRPGEGAERCREIVEEGGVGATSASILLQRCLFELGEGDHGAEALERLAQRYPMAYEVAVTRNTKAPARADAPAQTELPEETMTERESSPEQAGGEGPAQGAPSNGTSADGQVSGADTPDGGGIEETVAGTTESPSHDLGFSVQVGAFSDVHNAETLVVRLADKGYEAVKMESEEREDQVYHCVRVGVFINRADAASLAAILEERENLNTTIVRTTVPQSSSRTEEE
jgi:cell division septation protein DedD